MIFSALAPVAPVAPDFLDMCRGGRVLRRSLGEGSVVFPYRSPRAEWTGYPCRQLAFTQGARRMIAAS